MKDRLINVRLIFLGSATNFYTWLRVAVNKTSKCAPWWILCLKTKEKTRPTNEPTRHERVSKPACH